MSLPRLLCRAARTARGKGRLTMPAPDRPLRILHAVRAPVGGIFRHILDLANGQADRGHEVGIIADSLTGGERAEPGAGRDRAAAEARRSSHRHPPRAVADRSAGVGALHAHDPAAEARRAARPRRQGRRLRPPAQARRPHHSRLHAARRLAALQARFRSRARSMAGSSAR